MLNTYTIKIAFVLFAFFVAIIAIAMLT